uniref:Methylated-DNA-[protein]-cysteine S-methyltransferase DNA binding domain-containing protein n=1 Tax=Chromera velia CCMP2878 TaxID=1169474 RepID=A0A0G4H2I1_9ALVE|eukprot:Cvel_5594.t1-p1 / transcript=Cvel_5594.t1 / gene=Cvel_5594 / organism=Chromera_velia_CCMP2878 / gene_product=hypothetical protein / transcript_product=hypothetical protein / location=Cvel_scaffold263:67026-68814(+) / protein_length=209 / sequence_SO=supercontig / SO=protein_coding / is_pseudo=false
MSDENLCPVSPDCAKCQILNLWHKSVYRVVRSVPRGRVVSYGDVAKALGAPSYSRHVGKALGALPPCWSLAGGAGEGEDQPEEDGIAEAEGGAPGGSGGDAHSVPWWRVVNSQGCVAVRKLKLKMARRPSSANGGARGSFSVDSEMGGGDGSDGEEGGGNSHSIAVLPGECEAEVLQKRLLEDEGLQFSRSGTIKDFVSVRFSLPSSES